MKGKALILVTALSIAANVYIFRDRDAYAYRNQISYGQLYPAVSVNPVKDVAFVNEGTVRISLRDSLKSAAKWLIAADGSLFDSAAASNPFLTLKSGLHSYQIYSAAYPDTLSCRIEYVPPEKKANASIPAFSVMYRNNFAAVAADEIHGYKNLRDSITKDEAAALGALINDTIGIRKEMPDDEKAYRLCRHFYKTIYASAGLPDDSTSALTTFKQYRAALAGKKIWCGIYARIFNLFGTQAGLITRAIELKSTFYGHRGSSHIMNEYFSHERRQWVAVDVMYNNIRYTGTDGRLLNVVQVKNTGSSDTGVKIVHASGDSEIVRAFAEMPPVFFDLYGREKDYYLYDSNTEEKSGAFSRLVKYVSPSKQYIYYSDVAVADNRKFAVKQILFYLMLVLLLSTGAYLFLNYLKKRR